MKVETKPKVDHTPADLDEASKVLLKAAALIEERGHCVGKAEGSDGSICVVAALTYAAQKITGESIGTGYGKPATRLLEALDRQGLVSWSDSTPAQEVISKLRAVALGL